MSASGTFGSFAHWNIHARNVHDEQTLFSEKLLETLKENPIGARKIENISEPLPGMIGFICYPVISWAVLRGWSGWGRVERGWGEREGGIKVGVAKDGWEGKMRPDKKDMEEGRWEERWKRNGRRMKKKRESGEMSKTLEKKRRWDKSGKRREVRRGHN